MASGSSSLPLVISPRAAAAPRLAAETPMTDDAPAPRGAAAAAGGPRAALFSTGGPQRSNAAGGGLGRVPSVKIESAGASVTVIDDDVIDLTYSPPPRGCGAKVKREAPAVRGGADAPFEFLSDDEDAAPSRAAPRLKTEAAAAAAPRVKTEAAAAVKTEAAPAPPLNRRQKLSVLRNAVPGMGVPRPIVRLGLRADGALGPTLDLGSGLTVHFPLPPAPPQVEFMRKAACALMEGRHGLLEAPTGTGKSLALLAAACGYQHAVSLRGVPEDVPVVFYAARTLNQLNQMVHELRRLAYRPLMTLLASRDSYCMLPAALKPGADKAHECEKATYKKTVTCQHLQVQEAMNWPAAHLQHFLPGGMLEAPDIEDLVKLGGSAPPPGAQRPGVCPYHTSRDLLPEGAGLVLVTYQQLLNPTIRSANGLNLLLEKAVIIWDEAHNVPGAAREAATLLRDAVGLRKLCEGLAEMRVALQQVSEAVVPDKRTHLATVDRLRDIASKLLGWLMEQVKPEANGTWTADTSAQDKSGIQAWTRHGAAAQSMVANVLQLSAASLSALRIQVRKMRAALIAADFESAAVKSIAINDVEEIITKLEFLMDADSGDFRLVVRRQDAASRQRSAVAGASPPMPSVHFTCLLGAVALKPLREATRCMLFASGTLGPPILLTSELALGDNCVAVSTAHHATIAAQLRLLVINNGRDLQGFSHPLETQYRNREGERGKLLYEALGNTILRLLRNIPGGTLVFWPSDSMMRAALDHWDLCGIKRALEQLVPVIQIDGPRMTADGSKTAMAKYRAAAAASTGTSCGALLLAVMRGRASEGTDFKDQAARGVIVVGLPLPPWQDAAVVMKRAYNDQRWKAADQRGPPDPRGGDAWYTNEGVRCAAQAIGRVIRHAGDYGTAILLDCRYAADTGTRYSKGVRAMLPRYTHTLLRAAHDADEAAQILQPFFAERRALAPVTPPVKLED